MNFLITGATGLIGEKLTLALLSAGHKINILTRSKDNLPLKFSYPVQAFEWKDLQTSTQPLEDIDVVIHLAGESVAGRWTEDKKKKIYDSRIETTKQIVTAINKATQKPKLFISGSAIGIYGNQPQEDLTEKSQIQVSDFLSRVCIDWEQLANELDSSVRKVFLRTGLVLSRQGGLLNQLEDLFRSGFAGPLGSGAQQMSWIHIDDLIAQILFIIKNDSLAGAFNGTAPEPTTNRFFTETLASIIGRPAMIPAPKFGVKLMMKDFADAVFCDQKVLPQKALEAGFDFKFKQLKDALSDLFAPTGSQRLFLQNQWIPQTPEQIFPFFSEAKNLEELTPDTLNFKVLEQSTPEIQEGTLIDYQLKIHGFPAKWRTEILDWKPGQKFVDQQLKGPYSVWHHTHSFEPLAGGTLMQDRVRFQLPAGWLGDLFGAPLVKKDVNHIFDYRRKKIHELFIRSPQVSTH